MYKNEKEMIAFIPKNSERFEFIDNEYPSVVYWKHENKDLRVESKTSTSYIYITQGTVTVKSDDFEYTFEEGWYGSVVGQFILTGKGKVLISERINYTGMNQFGGPIENLGRLNYIDGCSSTLLLSALKLGDPCFNFLYVPSGIDQTAHTHPTLRVGYIISGTGTVKLTNNRILDLKPGVMFCLFPDALHSFHTNNDELRIVIYHPDSDFGPSDEVHPMLNRTIIDGVSARIAKR